MWSARKQIRSGSLDLHLYGRDSSVLKGDAAVVALPSTTNDVQVIVGVCVDHGRPFVARGSGTGLAGGAVPLNGAVVIATTRMNKLLEVDIEKSVRLGFSRECSTSICHAKLAGHGFHFAPDPSSQQVCSIGGNVANNSGGPHCLAYGVTSAHVLAIEVILPSGEITLLGGLDPEPPGYDLRGLFVGSEGTLGIATRIAVRLTPNPPAVKTLLLDFMED